MSRHHQTSPPTAPTKSRLPSITAIELGALYPPHPPVLQPLHVPHPPLSGLELLRVATEVVGSSAEAPSGSHDASPQRGQSQPKDTSHKAAITSTASAVASAAASAAASPAAPVKVYKKRGRKPTPGLTEEDRKQARLLKNRRTAEMSRRRKMQDLHDLQADCAGAKSQCAKLTAENARLRAEIERYKRKLQECTSQSNVTLSEISGEHQAAKDTESDREMTAEE